MTEHDDALSLDMVTAALRADSTDVAIYARVLAQSLGEALPGDCVSVERDRTMFRPEFRCVTEFGRYRGIAGMAELAAGSTQSRMTQLRHEQNILLRRTGPMMC